MVPEFLKSDVLCDRAGWKLGYYISVTFLLARPGYILGGCIVCLINQIIKVVKMDLRI